MSCKLSTDQVIDRLATLLGCDPELWDVEIAIQEILDEQDVMRATIGSLRAELAAFRER